MDWINFQLENNQVNFKKCDDVLEWNAFIQNNVNNNSKFNAVHLNIRSLRKHWYELLLMLGLSDFDIICLSEINITEEEIQFYNLKGYRKIYKLRKHKTGGGLLLFVKDNYSFVDITVSFDSFECIAGTIKCSNSNLSINIIFVYRPPNLRIPDFVNDIRIVIDNLKEYFVLFLGDVNINLFDSENSYVKDYEIQLYNYGLSNVIESATREEIRDELLSSTLIDHIFIRAKNYDILSGVLHTKISDHYPVVVFCNRLSEDLNRVRIVDGMDNYHIHIDDKKVNLFIKECNWIDCYTIDANKFALNISDKFKEIYNKCKLIVRKDTNTNRNISDVKRIKGWMTLELYDKIKEKDRLFRKWKSNPNNQSYRLNYTSFRNRLNNEIKKAKDNFHKKNFESNLKNTKKIWYEINSILNRKTDRNVDRKIIETFGRNLIFTANTFARTFVNQIDELLKKNISDTNNYEISVQENTNTNFYIPYSTPISVQNIIDKEISINKAPGFDLIRAKDIVCNKIIFSHLVSSLLNVCIRTGIFPDILKISIIRPLYKNGDKSDYMNYRPISILSVIEKILEKYIVGCLKGYLSDNNVINANQYGFQKGKGTEKLIVQVNDYLNNQLNKTNSVLAIFIDYSRAFDTVKHAILIKKLEEIGVTGIYLQLFKCYLSNRKFVVKIGNEVSDVNLVGYGVPQGSCLGPILFIIYVNNIFNVIKECKFYMYADDAVLMYSHRNMDNCYKVLQNEFNCVVKWSIENNLFVNSKKTKVVHFRSPYIAKEILRKIVLHNTSCASLGADDILCNCNKLDFVSEYSYLGVIFDDNLKFHKHVEKLFNKAKKILGCMYALKFYVDTRILKIVYKSLLESILRYGVQIWGGTNLVHISKLMKVQGKCLKLVVKGREMSNYELLKASDTLTPKGFYEFYNIINNFGDNFYKKITECRYAVRRKKYIVPRVYNNYGERTLKCIVPKLYNKLPDSIIMIDKYSIFKENVKAWLQATTNEI
jgi:hypothetical protein